MEKIPMTQDGLVRLEDELKRLRTEERPAVIRALAEAREHGDLSENAEYHAARERQSFIEGRLAELEDIISRAQVIDTSQISGDVIRFGATVLLADEDTEEEATYRLVGSHEADAARRPAVGDVAARPGADRQDAGRRRRGEDAARLALLRGRQDRLRLSRRSRTDCGGGMSGRCATICALASRPHCRSP